MAYIPKDDEEQQTGMNVLAPQNQQNQPQQDPNQPQNVSGGQGASIDAGQGQQATQGGSQAPKGAPKKASSGMFTNIRKYMDRNKPGAQQMGQKLQQNVSQQNPNIQQAVNKQETDFMSRVNQNRARLGQAQGFGQDVVKRAQIQEYKPQLEAQQQQLQQRADAIAPTYNQYVQSYAQQQEPQQSFEDYTKEQLGYETAQQQAQQSKQAYQDAVGNIQGLQDQLSGLAIISKRSGRNFTPSGLEGYGPTYYDQASAQEQLSKPNTQFLENAIYTIDKQASNITKNAPRNRYGGAIIKPEQQAQLDELQAKKQSILDYQQGVSSTRTAQQEAASRLEGIQSDLSSSQEAQRLYQNKQNLQNELASIQDKIANAPEQLTDAEVQRFNNIRTGIERFDDAILNISEQKRQTEDLAKQAESLGTLQGRRDSMRKQFGAKGGYTAGQASLDNLIMTGDKQAMRELLSNSQKQAEQAQASVEDAFRQGNKTRDEMSRATRHIQEDLQTNVDQAQTKLLEGSKDYRELQGMQDLASMLEGVDTNRLIPGSQVTTDINRARDAKVAEARKAMKEAGYTSEDIKRLQELQNMDFSPEDIGLKGRAATGEGTIIRQLQDKLASGQGLSAEELNLLGLTQDNFYAQTPTEMLQNIQIDPETFSIQDVATSQDVARASALARLAGGDSDAYMQNQLGIEQGELKRIQSRGVMDEGDKFATTYDELSKAEKDALSGARGAVEQQQAEVKRVSKTIDEQRNLAQRALGERSKEGGGTPHWKYWNHMYVQAKQKEAQARNQIKNMMNEENMVKSESVTKQQALEDYLKRFRK